MVYDNRNDTSGKIKFKPAFLILCILIYPLSSRSQSMKTSLGYNGLNIVPSAETADDGTLTVGYSRIPRSYGLQSYPARKSVFYMALAAAPFFEASFAFVIHDHLTDRSPHAGDRTVSAKLRLLREKKYSPSIGLGAHDFFGITQLGIRKVTTPPPQNYAALYAVASKSFASPWKQKGRIHIGYGTDWLPAEQHFMVGIFAGIELTVIKEISLMAEYDAQYFNIGARLNLFSHLQTFITCMNGRELSGGLSFCWNLRNY